MERARSGWAFRAYVAVTVVVLALGVITLLSIGAFLLPIGLAMAVGIVLWERPRAMVAVLAGGAAFSAALLLTAPLACESGDTGLVGPGREPVPAEHACERILLPDLARRARAGDYVVTLAIAVAAAAVGVAGGVAVARTRAPRGT